MATKTHEPQSLDEQLVAFAGRQAGCMKGEGVIPPPEACPAYVHSLAGAAEWHLATIVIVLLFAGMMFELTMFGFTRGGGGHH